MLTVKIVPCETNNPPGKLADAELHFGDHPLAQIVGDTTKEADARRLADEHNPLAGLKLIGFSVWGRRTGAGRNVTFPARQYSVNGERRSFALLRPIDVGDASAQTGIRDLILAAYTAYEQEAAASA